LPPDIGAGWWSAVQEHIRRSEYNITWQESTCLPPAPAAYQAPNRGQGLRTYFTPAGIHVIPRVLSEGAPAPPWRLDLALTGYGPAGDVWPAAAAELVPAANRIEYRRGPLTETYTNGEQGLVQRLNVSSPPGEASLFAPWDGGAIRVTLPATTTLFHHPSAAGDVVNNYAYLVLGINGIGERSGVSNRVGEFGFALTPGAP
jgi:hypothetical protein